MKISTLSAQAFANEYHPEMQLIDVRSPAEYAAQRISGAKNIPLDQLQGEEFCQSLSVDDKVYLICQQGGRAAMAAKALSAHTEASIFVVEGGTPDSIAHGCPCEGSAKSMISIERQVRIAAGSIALLGTLLGVFVAEGFLLIPAFVGSGLLFAGLTDSCAMGMLLGKMPWNK